MNLSLSSITRKGSWARIEDATASASVTESAT